LKEELIACGAEVIGPAHDVDSGFELAKSQLQIDAAVIDLNLAGEFAFHLVDELVRRGTPVIFTTGYDVEVVPYRLRHIARYMKPIPASEIAQGVADLILEQQSKAEQAPSTINRRSASQHGEFADHSHAHSEPRFMNVLLPRLIF
jgi:DNA-binding NarL/FixJ family response regulator